MTTVAAAPTRATRGNSRVSAVIRLLFVNPRVVIVTPLIVLAGIFLINVVIWVLIDAVAASPDDRADAARGFGYSGSAFFLFVYMAVVAIQAMNGSFRFALGFGATRRDYYLGTVAGFGVLSVGWAVLLSALGVVEQATGGWGLGGRMFTPVYFGTTVGGRFVVELCLLLFSFFAGSAFGSMFVRWQSTGLLVLSGVLLVALIATAGLIQVLGAWAQVFAWIGDNAPVGLALWSLVVTAAFAALGFLVLRRATPQG